MKRALSILLLVLGFGILGYTYWKWQSIPLITPVGSDFLVKEYVRTLDKYTFERLATRSYAKSPITLDSVIKETSDFTAYIFSFTSDGKKVTGRINIPKKEGNRPIMMMIRGYVEKEIYYSGLGTARASEAYAKAGYITVAPDFLGYGGSDPESLDILEARFEKPATVLNLLASLESLQNADTTKIGFWGHSNGGQITLSVLEITGKPYPATLWAPMPLGFPDSVTAYFADLPDKGAYIQKQLDVFHERYKDEDYSILAHLEAVSSKLHIHRGMEDEAVKSEWTEALTSLLKEKNKQIEVYIYPRENHNFTRGSFEEMMRKDVELFSKELNYE